MTFRDSANIFAAQIPNVCHVYVNYRALWGKKKMERVPTWQKTQKKKRPITYTQLFSQSSFPAGKNKVQSRAQREGGREKKPLWVLIYRAAAVCCPSSPPLPLCPPPLYQLMEPVIALWSVSICRLHRLQGHLSFYSCAQRGGSLARGHRPPVPEPRARHGADTVQATVVPTRSRLLCPDMAENAIFGFERKFKASGRNCGRDYIRRGRMGWFGVMVGRREDTLNWRCLWQIAKLQRNFFRGEKRHRVLPLSFSFFSGVYAGLGDTSRSTL